MRDEKKWYVVLTEPQQEILAVWRLHQAGHELFTPIIRKRVKTGRMGRNGQKVTKIVARPMFPGYGFVQAGQDALAIVLATRGVSRVLYDVYQNPVLLPDAAVRAVFSRQIQQQHEWLQTSQFKSGDKVRIEPDGGVYAGMLATVDKVDGKGRVEILLGMIRHSLPADMVAAA
ncbi:transcription termination/antitermination protein NusG [Tardiphaga sp. 367_B4_N1_1]|uniref:transcription termination/antitermination protein NusG n=1 Tax=Tardiphaga sp. 367_B4_N1_1 TaxID=3240777 RepID=UPI003F2407CE